MEHILMQLHDSESGYVKNDDPWVKEFLDFITPLCDNRGMLSKQKLLEITGWKSLQLPWGYNLPFDYVFKEDQQFYIKLKKDKSYD